MTPRPVPTEAIPEMLVEACQGGRRDGFIWMIARSMTPGIAQGHQKKFRSAKIYNLPQAW